MEREPEVQRKLDSMNYFFEWWRRATDEQRVALTRAAVELERLERLGLEFEQERLEQLRLELKPADAPTAFANAQA
jgi:hypothetical protein